MKRTKKTLPAAVPGSVQDARASAPSQPGASPPVAGTSSVRILEEHFAAKEYALKRKIRHLQGQLRLRSLELSALFWVRNQFRRLIKPSTSHIP